MNLDEGLLKGVLQGIHRHPTAVEANAIIDVARLAAAADKRTDIGEMVVLLALARTVCEMAGLEDLPLPTTAIDTTRLLDIGETLVPMGARELAFAVAFLVMIQDLDLTKEESQLADRLGEALVIEPARAYTLAAEMEALARAHRS